MVKNTVLASLLTAFIAPAPPATTTAPAAPRFELGGSASALDAACIRLTPDAPWMSGSAWAKTPIDLEQPFDLRMSLAFGDKDALGADGIVFALAPRPATGWRGEGLGFAGIEPSLGIELDTYQNVRENDPAADHLGLVVNGFVAHGPIDTDVVELPNLEDGRRHAFRVTWSPAEGLLSVYLDGTLRARYSGTVVRGVFGRGAQVFWGLTAGTGRKSNVHDVCFDG